MDERDRILALIEELEAQKASFADPIEGCEDLLLLDTQSETKHAVGQLLTAFNRRVSRIDQAITALQNLLDDNYPVIPSPVFSQEVARDIADQDRTVSTAASFFPVQDTMAAKPNVVVGSEALK